MPGPLEGVLVIDTAWGLPGSITGMLLADYGATVVKLERPTADPEPAPVLRSVVERGKWSVVIDPSEEANAPTVEALLARADVLLDSGPGAPVGPMAPSAVADRHSHLVYCRISGYGVDGLLCDRPGFDALVATRLGMMIEQPGHRKGPVFLGHPAIDYLTAFLATIGVLAALRARRHRTGHGQFVETSLLDGALAVNAMNWWFNEHDLSHLARTGDEEGFGRDRLITDLFECGDGENLMIHIGGQGGLKRAMDLLGLGDVVREVAGLEMSTPLNPDEYHAPGSGGDADGTFRSALAMKLPAAASGSTLEERVARQEAAEEVRALVAAYAAACDAKDLQQLEAICCPEVVVSVPGASWTGLGEALGFFHDAWAASPAPSRPFITNVAFRRLEPDHVEGTASFLYVTAADQDTSKIGCGSYHDHYVRHGGRMALRSKHINMDLLVDVRDGWSAAMRQMAA